MRCTTGDLGDVGCMHAGTTPWMIIVGAVSGLSIWTCMMGLWLSLGEPYAILELELMLIPVCESLWCRMGGDSPSGTEPTRRVLVNS